MNRLQEKYKNVVVPQMMKDFEYKSVMEVPHVEKVVINWEAAYGKAYKIQTSTDGKNWTTVKDLTNQDGGEDTVTFNTVNARYVRMQGVTRALPYGYSIYEFEVYGR